MSRGLSPGHVYPAPMAEAILVVDDDAPIRRMLDRALRAEGYEVDTAADGGDALAAVERSAPDLGELTLDIATRTARLGGVPLPLSGREAALLELLLRNARRVVTREQAIAAIWGGAATRNVVDRYVSNLRRKLGTAPSIDTVRGVGFVLR